MRARVQWTALTRQTSSSAKRRDSEPLRARSDPVQCDTFARSGTAVFELSTRFAEPFKYPEGADEQTREQARKLLFAELTQVCLWGNSVRRDGPLVFSFALRGQELPELRGIRRP